LAAGPWVATNTTREKILKSQFDWDSDTWKHGLFLSTSNLTVASTTYAGVTNEVATAFGYTQGGQTVTFSFSGTTSVTVTLAASTVWTASGGSIVARWSAIWEASGDIAFFCLCDSTPADVTATTGNTFTVSNSNPVFTLA
jgi:hypothetical protein